MELQHLKRRKCFLTKAIWKYKHASDSFNLRCRLQKRLVSDISGLYENSSLSDLVLECPKGIVYGHRVVIACRSPSFWHLLSKLLKAQQSCSTEFKSCNILTIYLPDIKYPLLHNFIRSLYTDKVNHKAGFILSQFLEEYLISLHYHRVPPKEPRLILEKLDFQEERIVQNLIFEQIRKGEISEQRGNLKDFAICLPKKQKALSQCRNGKQRNLGHYPTSAPHFENFSLLRNNLTSEIPCCLEASCYVSRKGQHKVNFFQHLATMESGNSSYSVLPNPSLNSDSTGSLNKCDPDEHPLPDSKCLVSDLKFPPSDLDTSSDNDTPVTYICAQSRRRLDNLDMNGDSPCRDNALPLSSSMIDQQMDSNPSYNDLAYNSIKTKVKEFESFSNGREACAQGCQNATSSSHNLHSVHGSEDKSGLLERGHGLLHETSSLEVEPSSSYDDQSLTPDSVKSDTSSVDKSPKDNRKDTKAISESEPKEQSQVNPHKPLVRTRTFEVLQPFCSNNAEDSSRENNHCLEDNSVSSCHPNPNESCAQSVDEIAQHLQKNCTNNRKENIIQMEVQEPLDKRELERKKGSLIFEHNFQTFSNIPTTNMMTSGMMNLSMSSESSMGLGSLYASMMSSVHSPGGTDQAILEQLAHSTVSIPNVSNAKVRGDSKLETGISSFKFKNLPDDLQRHALEKGCSRSPSPDSLSVDEIKDCVSNPNLNSNEAEKTSSKEHLDIEIKEKDEKELSIKEIQPSSMPGRQLIAHSNIDSYSTASLRPLRCSEDIPIVAEGLTRRQDSITEDSHPSQPHRQTSCGSVKDVDSIPLVTGYVALDDDSEKKNEDKNSQDLKSQSMFSMFIDFNEIPTPEVSKPKETSKGGKQPSGGMYMFIEADTLSPKIKRRTRTESEGSKPLSSNSPTAPKYSTVEENPNSDPEKGAEKQKEGHTEKFGNEHKGIFKDEKKSVSEKRGFFVFIDAEDSPQNQSPKLKKRQVLHRKPKSGGNVMSKSAPSDSILFKGEEQSSKVPNQETSNKFMTKSVIDRDEFMSQPPARRNVSLNDKINESSKIPRPVSNFKARLSLGKDSKSPENQRLKEIKPLIHKPKKPSVEETNGNNIKSMDTSVSDTVPSLNVSFSEVPTTTNLSVDFGDLSEVSDVSSLLSSLERSNEPSDQEGKAAQKGLGDDLLKMLLNEVNTDVTIQIGERKIKAHKCILASRCIYFAAMLSGHYVESAGNVIKLQGFSFDSVMMALKHIYSGTSSVPEGAKVGELAALADMLALDGLKDVVSLYLKSNLCHYFHKPCAECLNGILDVLPLAAAYSLDDLYHNCLNWAAKYFIIVFPTRNFASLPPELQDRCLKQLMDDMSVGTIINTALGCEKVLALLPIVRWAQSLLNLTTQLLESCSNFIATNMSAVLASDRFVLLGRDESLSIDSLEELLKASCELIRPDQAVLSHIHLTKLLDTKGDEGCTFTESYLEMLGRLLKQIEKFIIHNANRVAVCRKWPLLPPEAQKRIKDAALIVIEFSKPLNTKPKLSSASRVRPRGTSIEPMPRARACSMSDQRLSRSASTTVVPPKNNTVKKLQPVSGRCHTPPPSTMRTSLQTPPPTRASTLRAQARQAAIQRSQSARTVAERPKSARLAKADNSREDINQGNQNSSSSSQSQSGFPRGSIFTRSLSRPEQGHRRSMTPILHGSTPIHHGSSLHVTTASGSRPNTPGITDRVCHKRNASGPPLTTVRGSFSEDEGSRKGSLSYKTRPQSGTSRSPLTTKVPRVHLLDFPSSAIELNDIGRENQNQSKNTAEARSGRDKNLYPPFVTTSTRSPLKENRHRISNPPHPKSSAPSYTHNGACGPNPEVRSRSSSIGSKSGGIMVPQLGLRNRSNTFSKDEVTLENN